ncbi:MAG TPA: RagB/SusD family nutrient uptake outer membrane protein [Prolixibacteraceae bacterium]|nr:RagB/SusD family nutrient uptake outer membrane protein [Prolixibacteraceae bacterium]
MKKYSILLLLLMSLAWGCNDKAFLDKQPTNILVDSQIWADKSLVLSVIADLYDRVPEFQTLTNWSEFASLDEGFASNAGDYGRHKNTEYGYGEWSNWDYGLIREVNMFIEKCGTADKLDPADKSRFLAEGRFIRANIYFELVKRMGGVPLILEPMTYDFNGDPTYLRKPRSKEVEVYDFIIKELDEIKVDLPKSSVIKSRATQGLILAMKSRVCLYAASIAKYGATTPTVTLPAGEVGIPAGLANGYYQKALAAAEELINSGDYSLYRKKENLSENFSNLFIDKGNNPEAIFVRDFKLKSGKVEGWTLVNQPWSQAEDLEGGRLNPSLNLVQSFEKLDNTYETYATNKADGDYIYFTSPKDMFANRDARLEGTVMLPGSFYKGKQLDIWAGFLLADGTVIKGDNFGARKTLPGKTAAEYVVGFDGPIDNLEFSAQSGFYVRKYMDLAVGSGQRGVMSEVWWIRYRLGEIYLNAAEAAFELGNNAKAATYMNIVRERAGLIIPLTEADITFDRVVHERKVELAFEGHELWDMKRWRLAHIIWNGQSTELTTNPGKADEVSTRVFGMWPYKYYNPGGANDGKYVFQKIIPAQVTNAHRFRLGNYYSDINSTIRNNNPLITRNPNQE